MLAARAQPASAGYVAIEQVTGTLAEKSGSFILQHSGHSSPAGQSLAVTTSQATAARSELAGISGAMEIIIAPDGATLLPTAYALPR